MSSPRCLIAPFATAILAILCNLAQAETYTWQGGTSGSWAVDANWNPTGSPGSGDTVVFGSTAVTTAFYGDTNWTINGLSSSGSANTTLQRTAGGIDEWLPVGNGGISITGAGNVTIHNASIDANQTWSMSGTGTLSMYNLKGNGNVTKTGVHVFLRGDNSAFTGKITVSSGTLYFSDPVSANTLGAVPGSYVADQYTLGSNAGLRPQHTNGTTLSWHENRGITLSSGNGIISVQNATATFDILTEITGPGGLYINGVGAGGGLNDGIVRLSGANTYNGATLLRSSKLVLANALALQNSTFSLAATPPAGTALEFDGSVGGAFTFGGLSGSTGFDLVDKADNPVALSVGNNHASTVFSGVLGGSGSLIKIGDGILTLQGANAYTGGTTINKGTLALGAAGVLPSNGAVTINDGTLAMGSYNSTVGDVMLNNRSKVTGTGVLTATSYLANVTVDGVLDASVVSAKLGGTGTLTKEGAGQLHLTGDNSAWTGKVVVDAGRVCVTQASQGGALASYVEDQWTLNAGDLRFFGGTHVWDANRGITLGAGWSRLSVMVASSNAVIDTVIRGGGSLEINTGAPTDGTITLTGTNAYTGATSVRYGSLIVDGSIEASSGVTLLGGTATLGGSGFVPVIGGDGLVSPGSSAGILTATSVNPGGGLNFAFELTGPGSPAYGNAATSVNDVLRLTADTPMTAALTDANVIDVYFGVGSLGAGSVFRGGVYVDVATDAAVLTDFHDDIKDATYNYYVMGDGEGSHSFGGTSYYTLADFDPALEIELSTVLDQAAFAGGTVTGGVMQFNVVPEPSSLLLLLAALTAASWMRRRKQAFRSPRL